MNAETKCMFPLLQVSALNRSNNIYFYLNWFDVLFVCLRLIDLTGNVTSVVYVRFTTMVLFCISVVYLHDPEMINCCHTVVWPLGYNHCINTHTLVLKFNECTTDALYMVEYGKFSLSICAPYSVSCPHIWSEVSFIISCIACIVSAIYISVYMYIVREKFS